MDTSTRESQKNSWKHTMTRNSRAFQLKDVNWTQHRCVILIKTLTSSSCTNLTTCQRESESATDTGSSTGETGRGIYWTVIEKDSTQLLQHYLSIYLYVCQTLTDIQVLQNILLHFVVKNQSIRKYEFSNNFKSILQSNSASCLIRQFKFRNRIGMDKGTQFSPELKTLSLYEDKSSVEYSAHTEWTNFMFCFVHRKSSEVWVNDVRISVST